MGNELLVQLTLKWPRDGAAFVEVEALSKDDRASWIRMVITEYVSRQSKDLVPSQVVQQHPSSAQARTKIKSGVKEAASRPRSVSKQSGKKEGTKIEGSRDGEIEEAKTPQANVGSSSEVQRQGQEIAPASSETGMEIVGYTPGLLSGIGMEF